MALASVGLRAAPPNATTAAPSTSAEALRGRNDALRDLTNGVLAVEWLGLPGATTGEFYNVLKERAGVEWRIKGGCLVTSAQDAHREGYNAVMIPEIQRRYGTNIFDLAEAEAQRRVFGDKPVAPPPTKVPPPAAGAPGGSYQVRAGDTLDAIARRNRVPLAALLKANPGVVPTRLRVGQRILIPAGAGPK